MTKAEYDALIGRMVDTVNLLSSISTGTERKLDDAVSRLNTACDDVTSLRTKVDDMLKMQCSVHDRRLEVLESKWNPGVVAGGVTAVVLMIKTLLDKVF